MSEEMSWNMTSGCFGKADIHSMVGKESQVQEEDESKKGEKVESKCLVYT